MKSSKSKKGLNYIKIVKGVVFAYLLTLALFLILGGALYFTELSEKVIPTFVVIFSSISIIVSGVNATRDVDQLGWLHGGLIGLFYVAILLIIGLSVTPSISFGPGAAVDLAAGFAIGAFSGALGVNL